MTARTAALLAALALGAGTATAQTGTGAGTEDYALYCAICHGAQGHGDGPLAELLTATPPDLTGLAAANGGEFPMLEVIHVIDGRTGLRGHGGPMPVYGDVFDAEAARAAGGYDAVIATRGRILGIAEHLEKMQR